MSVFLSVSRINSVSEPCPTGCQSMHPFSIPPSPPLSASPEGCSQVRLRPDRRRRRRRRRSYYLITSARRARSGIRACETELRSLARPEYVPAAPTPLPRVRPLPKSQTRDDGEGRRSISIPPKIRSPPNTRPGPWKRDRRWR